MRRALATVALALLFVEAATAALEAKGYSKKAVGNLLKELQPGR